MARGFQFRFETLLRHRRMVEDERQRELAQLLRARMILTDQLTRMQQTIRDSKRDMTGSLAGRVDLGQVAQFVNYSQHVQSRGQQIVARLAQLEGEVEESRQRLLDATRQRKALELLRDRDHAEWRRTQDRREQEELDELATQAYVRRQSLEPALENVS